MGIAERKQKQKEELRTKILDVAMAIMIAEGFEEVSIRNIAKRIEYSPTTLYLYFTDKNEILLGLCDRGFDKLVEYQQTSLHISDPMMRLYGLGEAYLRFGIEHPQYYDLMFMRSDIKHPENETINAENTPLAFQILVNTVMACLASGKMHAHSAHAVALVIWSAVHGMVTLAHQGRLAVFPEPSIHTLLRSGLQSLIQAYTIPHTP
jgi:AcrR family transcriptional regulator